MQLIYTIHARQRMSEVDRNISDDEVEATIKDPDFRRPGRGGTFIVDKTIARRKVRVVYREAENSIIVITVTVLEALSENNL